MEGSGSTFMHLLEAEYLPETPVEIIGPGTPAEVDAVMYSRNGVEYRITFWDDKMRRTEWVNAREIRPMPIREPAGFKPRR